MPPRPLFGRTHVVERGRIFRHAASNSVIEGARSSEERVHLLSVRMLTVACAGRDGFFTTPARVAFTTKLVVDGECARRIFFEPASTPSLVFRELHAAIGGAEGAGAIE